ncbi:Bug family tripartite tricarboxylate transporter substrate binding protein [Roseomonas chloroacetimidivorans]|uniref:Bug family tripartite tricarboxylate transporter substrate binding protein n=1 Tax=Roseomonas chloroacetimidivorans TaxID=1766656 RepID=UPI003C788276
MVIIPRRAVLSLAALSAIPRALAQPRSAWQPARPIEVIVGFAPGANSDLPARAIAQAAAPLFPVPLVVVNRPGASGALAAQYVAGLPPDGQTLLIAGGSESLTLPAFREVPYDPRTSFRAIIRLTRQPLFIVARGNDGAAGLAPILQAARERPGEIAYASSGIGSIYHALFVLLERASGTELLHAPYQGGAPALQALLSGTVRLTGAAPEDMGGLLETGQIRLLAVASPERLDRFPAVPTLRELGFDVQVEGMKGLVAPAGLPDAAAAGLHDRFREAMASPAWKTFLERTGATEGYLDGPAFQAEMNRITDRLRAALKPA